ncbi:MAG: threonylcarbamoyl-AMP synthase [Chloroflexi bacterium]|nr:threonylcarbamoyl-AMP synthase [Chloroflexota bacterium]MYF81023.1 threonylcarbamoyl-AMP synthase [Chloroflexota bacterium]MYI03782.1 threonylcarbamoyl-AMP synthase [Chloroflexota bacterium]
MIRAEYAVPVSFDQLDQAVDHLRGGGVVALPTDTQYALSGIATDDHAVASVFRLKRRPGGENLPVFLPPARWRDHLEAMAEPLEDRVFALAESAWPGAVTLIVNKRADWPTRAVDGATIALRIPDHPVASALLDMVDAPLTGTSANVHGEPASLSAYDVRRQFAVGSPADRVSESLHILDEYGVTPAGTASTILDCTGQMPRVLRRGPMLSAQVGELLMRHWGLSDLDSGS